jgi:Schlafen, AlbA_2
MPKRSITDREIALIKAMIARGHKNKDIQFFFNRPNRPVNTGRISTIGKGTYSNSSKIPAASDAELDSFLLGSMSREPGASPHQQFGPNPAEVVRALFKKTPEGPWMLGSGESDEHECKVIFDPRKLTSVVRTAAALANNKGGYIFFGVANSTYRVEGIDGTFDKTDIIHIVEKLKAHLSPTPEVTAKQILNFDGKIVGFLKIEKHPHRPIIVYRDGEGLNEGEILFRYPGQSSRIKFGDLRNLLEERDRRAQVALASAAGRIADVGTGNALILDTDKNVLDAKGHSILIDQKLAESLRFIKEGEFDEKHGAPTLKLIGEVTPVTVKGATATTIVAHAAIFQEDILDKFLNQNNVDQPIQYIYAGLAQSRLWHPIFYYARMSGKTNSEIADLVKNLKVSQKGKKRFLIERLERRRSAFASAVTQLARKISVDISKGSVNTPTTIEEVTPFAQAVTAVKKTTAKLEDLLAAMRRCKEIAEKNDHSSAMGTTFKAACWLDELFFANKQA